MSVGQTFNDPGAGISMTLRSADAAGASIDVTVTSVPDTTPPPAPQGLVAALLKRGGVSLSWQPSSAVDFSHFEVFRDGQYIASTPTSAYSDSPGSGVHIYYVIARDQTGNASLPSNTVQVGTTKGGGRH